ncbi:hypothetical protein C8Q73DRAFT_51333 [Cubamyces lactineus]|nr:hypothetical protein C8Q73DRAFT_51333 [Cubamyces lactineus]
MCVEQYRSKTGFPYEQHLQTRNTGYSCCQTLEVALRTRRAHAEGIAIWCSYKLPGKHPLLPRCKLYSPAYLIMSPLALPLIMQAAACRIPAAAGGSSVIVCAAGQLARGPPPRWRMLTLSPLTPPRLQYSNPELRASMPLHTLTLSGRTVRPMRVAARHILPGVWTEAGLIRSQTSFPPSPSPPPSLSQVAGLAAFLVVASAFTTGGATN